MEFDEIIDNDRKKKMKIIITSTIKMPIATIFEYYWLSTW